VLIKLNLLLSYKKKFIGIIMWGKLTSAAQKLKDQAVTKANIAADYTQKLAKDVMWETPSPGNQEPKDLNEDKPYEEPELEIPKAGSKEPIDKIDSLKPANKPWRDQKLLNSPSKKMGGSGMIFCEGSEPEFGQRRNSKNSVKSMHSSRSGSKDPPVIETIEIIENPLIIPKAVLDALSNKNELFVPANAIDKSFSVSSPAQPDKKKKKKKKKKSKKTVLAQIPAPLTPKDTPVEETPLTKPQVQVQVEPLV
jgi:hypothetical protein